MKPSITTIILCLLVALITPSLSHASDQEAVLDAIRARLAATARRDIKAWAHFVDDDMLAPLEGELPSKRAWIQMHKSWPADVEYWYGPIEDPKVRIHGDTAVAIYHARQFTRIGGQTTSVHKWQIETHRRDEGRWVLVGVADGLIPPEPVAVRVDAGALDAYAGDYEWSPTLISKIRRRGEALYEEFPNQSASELSAENATTFFVKGEAASGEDLSEILCFEAYHDVQESICRERRNPIPMQPQPLIQRFPRS